MKKRQGSGYFVTDLQRIFRKKETYIGIAGVTAALFFSINANPQGTVIDDFLYGTYGAGFVLAFVFCCMSYGTVYSEELENHYIRYAVSRGGLKRYVAAKTAAIFLGAVWVMGAGCVLFGILTSLGKPWMDENIHNELIKSGGYFWLAEKKCYILWILAYGLQWGLLAGALSLTAAFVSLFITNRLLVLAVPILCYQVITEVSESFKTAMWSIQSVFDARYRMFGSDGKMILWAMGLSFSAAVILGWVSYKRLKKRM